MIINRISLIIVSVFLMLSCKGQKGFTSYKDCMDKSFQNTGIDFYANLRVVEDKLLKTGALKSKSREGYVDAFKSILGNDKIWKSHYESYLLLEKTSMKEFDLKTNRFVFLGICSSIDPRFDNIKPNPTNVQRYLFNQFVHKPFDDTNLLDGLLLFTDFNNNELRYNITYLLLLNMGKKYDVTDDTPN